MKYHFKHVQYEQLDKTQKVAKGKVVLNEGDFKMMRDYIVVLESHLFYHDKKPFGTIQEELTKLLGEEKVKEYYK